MKHLIVVAFLLLWSSTLLAAKPNIVLILSDDHSYPYVGCYGLLDIKTPALDRFAEGGIKFRRMFTGAPQCVPSRATIMTGRSPVAARMTRFSATLPREEITFPELLKRDAGYFVGVLGRDYHLDGSGSAPADERRIQEEHNLNTFRDRFDFVDSSNQNQVPMKMNEFFDQKPNGKPYFLWINFNDPHFPWNTGKNPPDPATLKVPGSLPDLPGIRKDLSAYMAEVENCDGTFQTVLEVLRARAGLENTLIMFMGDNGMAFPGGKGSLHDPGINVPFLVSWQGMVRPGGDLSVLLSGEDLAPTCLEAAGVKIPVRMSGLSFMPLLKGEPFQHQRRHVFAERGPHGGNTMITHDTPSSMVDYSRCVRSERYKLIYNVTPSHRYTPVDSAGSQGWRQMVAAHEKQKLSPEFEQRYFAQPRPIWELYDLQNDPSELYNICGKPDVQEIQQQLTSALREKMILDFDYLPLPGSSPAPAGAQKKDRK